MINSSILKTAIAVFALSASILPALAESPSKPSAPIAKGEKYAVVFGISKFQDSAAHLDSGAADAEDFYKYLTKKANFAPGHVILLTDKKADRTSIYKLLGETFIPTLRPEDLVVIYFSTLGTPAKDDYGHINYLVASDTKMNQLFAFGIDMQNLPQIVMMRTRCNNVVFIINSSYSGAMEVKTKSLFRTAKPIPPATLIASCGADQTSVTGKNTKTSIFNKRLIEALQIKGNATTIGEAFTYLKSKVQTDVKADSGVLQTPVLKCETMNLKIGAPAGR